MYDYLPTTRILEVTIRANVDVAKKMNTTTTTKSVEIKSINVKI
jgi:hypothetical protein